MNNSDIISNAIASLWFQIQNIVKDSEIDQKIAILPLEIREDSKGNLLTSIGEQSPYPLVLKKQYQYDLSSFFFIQDGLDEFADFIFYHLSEVLEELGY